MKILLMFLLTSGPLWAAPSPKIYQPKDQTDVYAIPLDEDEQSQDEELETTRASKKVIFIRIDRIASLPLAGRIGRALGRYFLLHPVAEGDPAYRVLF